MLLPADKVLQGAESGSSTSLRMPEELSTAMASAKGQGPGVQTQNMCTIKTHVPHVLTRLII